MSAKAIREATGKNLINKHLGGGTAAAQCRFAAVDQDTKFAELIASNPWLKTEKLVVKPDQLIKRRGKLGAGASMTTLKRHGGWKSTSVAEGYLEDSLSSKNEVSRMLAGVPPGSGVSVQKFDTQTMKHESFAAGNFSELPILC